MPRCLTSALVLAGFGLAATAHAQDTNERWRSESEASVLSWVASMPEVTHLDAVWLRIGDDVLLPRICEERNAPYCTRDGTSLRLEQGESVELEFRVPARLQSQPAFVVAHGMYVPLD